VKDLLVTKPFTPKNYQNNFIILFVYY